jgi:hypothetical protein
LIAVQHKTKASTRQAFHSFAVSTQPFVLFLKRRNRLESRVDLDQDARNIPASAGSGIIDTYKAVALFPAVDLLAASGEGSSKRRNRSAEFHRRRMKRPAVPGKQGGESGGKNAAPAGARCAAAGCPSRVVRLPTVLLTSPR